MKPALMPADTLPRPEGRTLADLVRVQRRFLRSVNLERDFYSADPLDGYLLTASAVAAFERLAQGVRRPHARAFSLTRSRRKLSGQARTGEP